MKGKVIVLLLCMLASMIQLSVYSYIVRIEFHQNMKFIKKVSIDVGSASQQCISARDVIVQENTDIFEKNLSLCSTHDLKSIQISFTKPASSSNSLPEEHFIEMKDFRKNFHKVTIKVKADDSHSISYDEKSVRVKGQTQIR